MRIWKKRLHEATKGSTRPPPSAPALCCHCHCGGFVSGGAFWPSGVCGGRGRKGDVSRRPSLHPHPPSGHPAFRLSLLSTSGPRSGSSSVLFLGCPHGPRLPTARASALETPGPGCQNALATQNRRNSTRYRSGSAGRSRLASTRKVPEKAQAEQRARGGTEKETFRASGGNRGSQGTVAASAGRGAKSHVAWGRGGAPGTERQPKTRTS